MRWALLILLSLCAPANAAERIGLAVPLTGRAAAVGDRVEFGALMAVTAARENGASVDMTLVDTACTADGATRVARKLAEANVEIVVGPLCTESAAAIGKAMRGIPVISLDNRNPLLERMRDVEDLALFELGAAPDDEATAVVEQVLPAFGGKPFAVLDDGSVGGRALSDAVRLKAEDAGLRPQDAANFRPLQRTQKPLLRRLARSGVEALFIAAVPEDVTTIARDMRELGLNWQLATGEDAALIAFTEGAADVPEGALAIMRRDPTVAQMATITKRLAGQNIDVADALLLGHAAMETALVFDPSRPLSEQTASTALGTVAFENGRATPLPFTLHRWTGTAFRQVGE